ncbi:MAG: hypothetical protein ACK6BG_05625 [Cyanobacteriota bacterium]
MTTRSISDLFSPGGASTLLAVLASGLLLFVSAGVIYLSIVDWRDRRRRRAEAARKP